MSLPENAVPTPTEEIHTRGLVFPQSTNDPDTKMGNV